MAYLSEIPGDRILPLTGSTLLGRDPACDIIMVGAEDWARAKSWRPGPSDG